MTAPAPVPSGAGLVDTDWPTLLTATAGATTGALAGAADADWSQRPPGSDWTARATLDHLALGLLGYAGLLTARPTDRYITLFGSLDPAAPIPHCLEGVRIAGSLLATVVRDTEPEARAWHPWGPSDGPGFAAMGTVELLVHTHDLARGLGLDWTVPDDLAAPAVARLFPDAPSRDAAGLLWSTGRTALPDHPRKAPGAWSWDGRVR
ncbi:maleylpyruvate isomerase N-terminal domain-containing protein [Kitasatospora sp. NPDC054939]